MTRKPGATRRGWLAVAVLAASGILLPGPAAAQAQEAPAEAPAETSDPRLEEAERYADCMDAARSSPQSALGTARTWQEQGGGPPARHCEGVALLSMGDYAQAAETLEDLARNLPDDAAGRLRTDALAQAGQAWVLAGEAARAEAVQTAALELAPEDVELRIDRAAARFELGDYRAAVADLDRALDAAPQRPDILIFRATAHRYADKLERAEADIDRALELDPDNPEGWLERGNLARLQEDPEGARQAWMQVIRAAPDSPAADSARANLERMDVAVED